MWMMDVVRKPEDDMGEDKLPGMLEQIALGTYDTYPSHGEYVFPPEQRIAAATALALLRVAQEIANIEITLSGMWAEHKHGPFAEEE
jgi:hypothetical protein